MYHQASWAAPVFQISNAFITYLQASGNFPVLNCKEVVFAENRDGRKIHPSVQKK